MNATLKNLGTDECLTCGSVTTCYDLGAVAPNTEAQCGVCYADSIAHGSQYDTSEQVRFAVSEALGREVTEEENEVIERYF